jgi:hypothetical protein
MRRSKQAGSQEKFTASHAHDTRAPWARPEHTAGAVKKKFPRPG